MRRTVCLARLLAAGFCFGAVFSSTAEARTHIRLHNSKTTDADLLDMVPDLTLAPGPAQLPSSGSDLVPLSDLPASNSLPGAAATIYLDFLGDTTTDWGSTHYDPGTTPAYDIDGDPSTFSQQELSNIAEIWSRVSEIYSPFNVNVTTADPGTPETHNAVRIVIGGDGKNGQSHYWYYPTFPDQPAGGISYVGSFSSDEPNTSYVFSNNLSLSHPGTPKYVAIAAAHEAGHAFGLYHQSDFSGNTLINEYSFGNYSYDPNLTTQLQEPGSSSPIMGNGYYADRALWWQGTSDQNGFRRIQNDVSVISSDSNGFGYRPDAVGHSISTATPLPTTVIDDKTRNVNASGVIDTISDQEFYSFSVTDPASVSFQVTGAPFGAMLDPSLALYEDNGTSDGQLIQMVATPSLTEVLNAAIDPGNYDVVILSAGVNVGDIGQYFLSGTIIVPEPAVGAGMMFMLLIRLSRRPCLA